MVSGRRSHAYQMLEAGVRQFTVWDNTDEGRHILIGVARYLAAHSIGGAAQHSIHEEAVNDPARARRCGIGSNFVVGDCETVTAFSIEPKSQRRWGHYPILPSPITRGNAASTNTLTASSGSTSQKLLTSLFCPMPMSKGSRTNSTLAPERYSATKPLARFSSAPEIRPLHFTVEWAKDYRPHQKQMVVSVIMDQDGRPVCSEMWPGDTADVTTLIPVIDRLRQRFAIGRVCVVADRGMISAQTIASLEERGLEYILGVRERSSKELQEVVLNDPAPSVSLVIPRRGRRDTELEAKEVRVGGRRYIVCRNLAEAKRDAEVRETVLRHLRSALRGGDKALVGNSAYRRYLKTPDEKHFEIDDNRVIEDARYDGLYVLCTNTTLNALTVMLRYRELLRVEDIFKTTKSILDTRPIYHKTDATIRGHVFCSFMALVVRKALDDRLAAAGVKPEWGRLLMDLDRLQDIAIEQDGKHFIVRTPVTGDVGRVFQAVGLALPPNTREAEAVVHTPNRPRPRSAWC